MRTLVVTIVVLLVACAAVAQRPGPDPAAVEAMQKLSFLEGTWKGAGWMSLGPGNKHDFQQTETVQSKANGTILLVEGTGLGKEGEVEHSAFAVIFYNPADSSYVIHAYKDGRFVAADADVTENSLSWGFEIPKRGAVQYTVTMNEDGQWHEVGKFSPDGETWFPHLEMTLTKQ